MNRIFGKLAMLLTLSIGFSTHAKADWVEIVKWQDAINYLDSEDIRNRPQTGIRRFWKLSSYPTKGQSSVSEKDVNCDDVTMRTLRFRHYMSVRPADPVYKEGAYPDQSWQKIIPESNAYWEYQFICGKR